MKQLNKKIVIGVVTAVVIAAGGMMYVNNKSTKSNGGNSVEINTKDGSKSAENKKEDEKNKIVNDDKLTKKIAKEDIVLDGQAYVQDDYVIGTMIIKDKVSEAEIKKVAQEYANKLKAQYKDKKVNVQAVQNKKNVADITIK